jgi:hypothetical protein
VVYPHESLQPILERTLGVPIFQEQLLRIAMTAAGFSGGEAEELRRAMGFKRSVERMQRIEERLRSGMRARGLSPQAEDEIIRHITSFALYGFPESHSASFALIAYASAYLKRHHPAAFLVGLLRAQPMGFYSPATLVKDAQRHGVEVRAVDVLRSGTQADLEAGPQAGGPPAVRIGLDAVGGLGQKAAQRIVDERERRPFDDLGDFVRRTAPDRDELDALAELGALVQLRGAPEARRDALWQVAVLERDPRSLFAGLPALRPHDGRASDGPSATRARGPRHPLRRAAPRATRRRLRAHGGPCHRAPTSGLGERLLLRDARGRERTLECGAHPRHGTPLPGAAPPGLIARGRRAAPARRWRAPRSGSRASRARGRGLEAASFARLPLRNRKKKKDERHAVWSGRARVELSVPADGGDRWTRCHIMQPRLPHSARHARDRTT